MRGGAIPIMFWALLLLTATIAHAIWTGDLFEGAEYCAALLAVLLVAGSLILRTREAARPGEPEAPTKPEPVTRASFGTVIAAIGVAAILFGLTFGHFIIYFGAGMTVAGLGRLAVELYHQRRVTRRSRP